MKIYISGSYGHKFDIVDVMGKIQKVFPSVECTSNWLTSQLEERDLNLLQRQACIDEDVRDIERADLFLLVNVAEMCTESPGRWIELGFAMAFSKIIIIWGGDPRSVFLYDKQTVLIPDNIIELYLGLSAIITTFNALKGETDAYRANTVRDESYTREETESRPDEDGSENAREGIRSGEGVPLSDALREAWSRAARAERGEA